jgi:AcrR family transcriptional regulator
VEIAIHAFAGLGYETTTNKYIADEAGITTGALYHYFDSKIEMYEAAYAYVQTAIYERLAAALDGIVGFVPRLEAVLEAAHDLNGDEPSFARLIGAARVDMARNEELRIALARPQGPGYTFFDALVDDGIAAGEIDRANRPLVLAFIRIIVVGLTDGASDDNDRHRVAVDAVRAAIEGRMFTAPATLGRNGSSPRTRWRPTPNAG